MRAIFFIIFFCATAFGETFLIGRDPTWYKTATAGKESYINGFLNALCLEAGKVEKVTFQIIDTDPLSLFEGLSEGKYEGVFSSLPIDVQSEELYNFSLPILLLGPVLVVPTASKVDALTDLKGHTIGISAFDNSVFLAQTVPSLTITTYESMPQALADLAAGKTDAVLLSYLEAHSLVTSLYKDTLRIATTPLTNDAIRIVTLKTDPHPLLTYFNRALRKLKKSHLYQHLRLEFNVS